MATYFTQYDPLTPARFAEEYFDELEKADAETEAKARAEFAEFCYQHPAKYLQMIGVLNTLLVGGYALYRVQFFQPSTGEFIMQFKHKHDDCLVRITIESI